MPIFKCSKCDTAENTALGAYWTEHYEGKPVLCSECFSGTWHERFPRHTVEEAGLIKGDDGFWHDTETLSPGGYLYGIVSPATEN